MLLKFDLSLNFDSYFMICFEAKMCQLAVVLETIILLQLELPLIPPHSAKSLLLVENDTNGNRR
jgi:hypothetical protein